MAFELRWIPAFGAGSQIFLLNLREEGLGEPHEVGFAQLDLVTYLSLSTEFSGGSLIDAPAEFGQPGSLSTCSLSPESFFERIGFQEFLQCLYKLRPPESTNMCSSFNSNNL